MKISRKLTLGFLGTSLLVGVVGYISLRTNASIQYDVMQLSGSSVHEVKSATKMASSLQRNQVNAYKLSYKNHATCIKIASNINKELKIFTDNLLLAKKANQEAITINKQHAFEKKEQKEIYQEAKELETIKNIETEFFQHKKLMLQYLNIAKQQPTSTRWFLENKLEPQLTQKLIPLITKHQADAETELKTEAKEIEELVSSVKLIILCSTFIAGATAILFGLLISRSIVKPITNLKNAATRVGEGQLDTKVDIQSKDEMGTLATVFNQMVEGLNKTTVSKTYLDNILKSMVDSLIVVDINSIITKVNQATINLLGYEEDELIGKRISLLFAEDSGLEIYNLFLNRFFGTSELSFLTKDGSKIPVSFSAALMSNEQAKEQKIVCVARDITERKRAEAQLRHDALHDALTDLPNRVFFTARLEQAIKLKKRRHDCLFAVLFLDLDRFKLINDSLGHLAGDQLLIAIVDRLKACLHSGDTIARLGGDEFTVLLEDIKDISCVTDVAERLQQALKLPFNLNGHEVFTTVSIGIALSTTGYDRAEDILRDADIAMYHAKSFGKARYEIFAPGMHAQAVAQLHLENDLRRAIERQEFQVYYQPIVSLKTGQIDGFEALVRWQHPERGLVSPAEFIAVAEETGLIIPIGYWVLHEACRQMHQWQQSNPANRCLTISVNLSTKQFSQPNLIKQVKKILWQTGFDACNLKLEITESALVENAEAAASMLLQLRSLGIGLHIDDFGTGYSSLSYLQRFPVTALKIDRFFVSKMGVHGENLEIVQTINMMAHNLGMEVVAEGLETAQHLGQLKVLGCQYGQGYFFSKPVDSEMAGRLIAMPPQWLGQFHTPGIKTTA